LRLAVLLVFAGLGCAQAQQTTTVPPPAPSLPSTFPQFQTYASCLMNCDTKSGTRQGTCNVSKVCRANPGDTSGFRRAGAMLSLVQHPGARLQTGLHAAALGPCRPAFTSCVRA
jgi:hypothetical protein